MYSDDSNFSNSDNSSYVDDYSPPSSSASAADPQTTDSTSDFNLDDALDKLQKQIDEIQNLSDSKNKNKPADEPGDKATKDESDSEVAKEDTKDSGQGLILDQPVKPRRFGARKSSGRFGRKGKDSRKFKRSTDQSQQSTQTSPPSKKITRTASESIEAQNIFEMLGVADTTSEQEQETFLDELQQVIWEDFLENDVELLITSKEFTFLQELLATEKAEQAKIFQYLQKLIPDLSLIMTEKAIELKKELFEERIAALEDNFADNSSILAKISESKDYIKDNKWASAVAILNDISISS